MTQGTGHTNNDTFASALRKYLSEEQLTLVRKKTIAVGGAGGLGSNVIIALARTGFRDFAVIDKDIVEASNLNRQHFTAADIGRPKVEALIDHVHAIDPTITVHAYHAEWTPLSDNWNIKDRDILIEAFDTADVKAQFVEHYRKQVTYVISGNGMAGLTGGDVTAVKKIGNIYFVGDGASCIHSGQPPLAPRVLQCAAKMAELALLLTLSLL